MLETMKTSILSKILTALLLLAMLLICFSCDVMKQSTKSKGEASASESSETWTKRKGDTVSFVVPKITYRDTTIYTVNRQGTTLRTVYNESGQISNIDCFASAIEEMTKQNRQFYEQWKEKDKTKEEKFDSSFILYIIGAVVILGMFGFTLIFLLLRKNTKAIELIAGKIT